jgi:hypothetical protein
MSDVKTPSGKTLTLEQFTNAEAAILKLATNNSLMLEHSYGTTAQDVAALVELAHERWYESSKRGRK